MATEVPWTNPEFDQLLTQKIGADWVQWFEGKWGSSWAPLCAEELTSELGSDWVDNPERATDVLAGLVVPDENTDTAEETAQPAAEETTEATAGEAADGEPDPDSIADIDLGKYEWLNTFEESDSFESWLTRIGLSAEDANSIATAESAAADGATADAPDPDSIVDVDLGKYEWLNTFEDADSFESWLTRIGVPAEDAHTIANAENLQTEETNQ